MIGIALIGTGKIALANHLPGIQLCPNARIVALCDTNPDTLEQAKQETGIGVGYTDYHLALERHDVDAVIIATPNYTHMSIAADAIAAQKHLLIEKPITMTLGEALDLVQRAEQAGLRNMTAFTYRFVPAMRYMKHLVDSGAVGRPYHFRARRFQDWGDRPLGWRQVLRLAGTGELADMLSHRIDYAHLLIGPMRRIVADLKTFIPQRGGRPSDVDDFVSMLADFHLGASGVLESTKLATGRGEGYGGEDIVELNGSEGTIVYSTQRPLELQLAKKGESELKTIPVPREFLVYPGSPRNPEEGDPRITFRYDQDVEFVRAIEEQRDCWPTLRDGARVQAVMTAAVASAEGGCWQPVPSVDR
jgi:predicted dehydrogenase